MTIAELHNKLPYNDPAALHERLEDLLTSDVFGTMKYVGGQYGSLDPALGDKTFNEAQLVEKGLPIEKPDPDDYW